MTVCGQQHSDYIFSINEQDINSVIYDLGTKYDQILLGDNTSILKSNHYAAKEKEVSNPAIYFLIDSDFVSLTGQALKDKGKEYFESLFVHNEGNFAQIIITESLKRNPIVNLVEQVFFGRGKINIDQLVVLLNYHRVAHWEIDSKSAVSLLVLLNKFGILVFDRKNRLFYLRESPVFEEPIKQYFISPSTPFSNIYNIRRTLRSCLGEIYWVDKHFRKEGLEIILDGLGFEGVQSVTIISGEENSTESAKRDYLLLKEELLLRGITLTWRIIKDKMFKWHDRWLVSDNSCYNIPPVLAIIRGQRSEILKTDTILDVAHFIEISECF